MTRLTLLFIVVALVLPGAALASAPDRDPGTRALFNQTLDEHGVDQAAAQRKAEAVARYYASHRNAQALPASATAPVATDGNGPSWTLAIGAGVALMLAGGGLGVYARRAIHPRHLGA